MSDKNAVSGTTQRPDADLSRRSLVAAGALLSAMGPLAASKAFAQGKGNGKGNQNNGIPGCVPSNAQPDKCLCFLSGTRILTPGGEVAIEAARIGDLVATESGEARAIRWIGRITVDRAGYAPWDVGSMPIRVAKDALGAGSPRRDLYLSRAHMVHLNGVLIAIGDLVNGHTITAVDVEGDRLVYFHIELETHDVLVAEGAPCESLLTTAEKLAAFDNVDEYYALFGIPASGMRPYAPLAAFNGGRSELKSRLRSALAPVIDIRRPLDIARDSIEERALLLKAA